MTDPRPVSPRSSKAVVAILVLASLVLWGWLHQYWFLSGDDYLFIADGNATHGRFSLQYWWEALRDDWTRRNGRAADGVLRLVLRPGPWFYPLFGPVMVTVAGLAVALLLTRAARLGRTPPWIWASGLLVIPFICWLVPGTTGDVIMWTAAAINYVMPLGLMAVVIIVHVALSEGRGIPWWAVAAAALLAVLVDWMQEVASVAMFFVAVVGVVAQRFRLSGKGWFLVAASCAAFAFHMTAAGLWRRSGIIADASGMGFMEAASRAMAVSVSELWGRTWILWVALSVLLAFRGLSRGTGRAERLTSLSAVAAVCLFTLGCAMFRNRDLGLETPTAQVVLVVVVTMLALVVVGVALLAARGTLGIGPLLIWVALVGSCVFVFASGAMSPRVHFTPSALLLVLVLVLVAPRVTGLTSAQRTALVALVLALPSLMWFDDARIGVMANHRFVETRIVPQLESAGRGETNHVEIPAALPRPDMGYPNSFWLVRYEAALRVYYGIGDDVTMVQEGA